MQNLCIALFHSSRSFPFSFFLVSHIRACTPFGLLEACTALYLRLNGARTPHNQLAHFCLNIGVLLHQFGVCSPNIIIIKLTTL
jgi:hypothetical protein